MSLWFDQLARFNEEVFFRARDAELIRQMREQDKVPALSNATAPDPLKVEQNEAVQAPAPVAK